MVEHPDFIGGVVGLNPLKYVIYILRSLKDGKFYIGSTGNLENRLKRHNSGRERSTKNRRPFELIYQEAFDNKLKALRREKQLKLYKSHKYLDKLISTKQGV